MDELLFISMAKLGADRMRQEREIRASQPAAAETLARDGAVLSRRVAVSRSTGSLGSPYLPRVALGLAVTMISVLGAAAIGDVYPDRVAAPEGEVSITQLEVAPVSADLQVAQNVSAAPFAR